MELNHKEEKNPNSKLTREDVEMIVILLAGNTSVRRIARWWGVSAATIGHIRTGRRWSEVPRPRVDSTKGEKYGYYTVKPEARREAGISG